MSTSAHIEARAAFLANIATRRHIEANIALAIKHGTGAIVEVAIGRARQYIVSGAPDHVANAAPVLSAAGLSLVISEHDDEIGETFATWESAA